MSSGHRERLLLAARQCIEEKGYGRTTARDLVALSGTNLASIGYHFGSKEALLNEAVLGALADYTERLLALASPAAGDPLARTRSSWIAMVDEFTTMRPLLIAFIEALTQAERNPGLRLQLAEAYERLRTTISAAVSAAVPGLPADCARAVASLMIVVSDGLMIQWLIDPLATPAGADLFDAAKVMFTAGPAPPDGPSSPKRRRARSRAAGQPPS